MNRDAEDQSRYEGKAAEAVDHLNRICGFHNIAGKEPQDIWCPTPAQWFRTLMELNEAGKVELEHVPERPEDERPELAEFTIKLGERVTEPKIAAAIAEWGQKIMDARRDWQKRAPTRSSVFG